MSKVFKHLNKKFPCRNDVLLTLTQLVGDANEAYPASIYIYGHSGTGKTAITKEFLNESKRRYHLRTIHLNCVEAYTPRILFESVLEDLLENDMQDERCENLKEFVEALRKANADLGYVVVLDSAERLRDMDANILSVFLRLPELTGLNICVVLISQLPFEKYYSKCGLGEVLTLFFPQYSKPETQCILSADLLNAQKDLKNRLKQMDLAEVEKNRRLKLIDTITSDFYANYLNLFLSVFFKACRDLPELKLTARKCFITYMEPVLDGSIDSSDVSRLWRNISGPLQKALAQVYLRYDRQLDEKSTETTNEDQNQLLNPSVRKQAQSLELPYYAKFLLIAAFLASYNSAKEDKRLFVKHHGKQRKRMQTVNAKAKVSDKMSTSIGPKSFTIDRLLAIFYAILEDKVGLTCNLLSQISTLVHLKLLNFVSGENNIVDGSARLQCNISLEFVLYIGKVVDFNVRQYLCDFM